MSIQLREQKLAVLLLMVIFCIGLVDYQLLRESEHTHVDRIRKLEEGDDDSIIDQQQTILPTLILTPAPTSPTGVPSTMPTEFPTIFSHPPTERPSAIPSAFPTVTQMPSNSPSVSMMPTISYVPSISPSQSPSKAPSLTPSESPTHAPSFHPSSMPSLPPSDSPTFSAIPSLEPSVTPTDYPTQSNRPSLTPSVSGAPTTTAEPTMLPSNAPTYFPTDSPSDVPTPRPPTMRPSDSPTNRPSIPPSMFPSTVPTMNPTLSVAPLSEPRITMTLQGMPAEFTATQQEEWENITSNHVFLFYKKFNEIEPGVIPVNVSSVETTFKQQSFQLSTGRLEIEYEQTIVFGRYRPIEDEEELFIAPFTENTQDYIIELLKAWDLDDLIVLKSVLIGEEESAPPPTQSQSAGISAGALTAISISIVLGACVVVAFLFWDKRSKNGRRSQEVGSQQLLEGAQSSQDWGHVEQVSTPPRPYSSRPGTSSNTVPTTADASSMVVPLSLVGSSSNRQRNSRGTLPTLSMRPNVFVGRDRDESELTFTDSDGGPPSEVGSDTYVMEPPTLPHVADTDGHFR
jgi:hypothetical protein